MSAIAYLVSLTLSVQMCKMRNYLLSILVSLLFLPLSAQHGADTALCHALAEQLGVPFSQNNSIVFFASGQEKFDDLFHTIRQARRSIHLEYFNFRNDSISRVLFGLLAEKVKEGVEVRVIFDGFGNSSNNRPLRKKHLDTIRSRGIEIYEYDPVRFPYINHAIRRDHRKIVVIDGLVAYTGGMNVADYYIKGKPPFGEWHDLHLRVEGEVVDELQEIFLKFWNRITHQDVHGEQYYTGGEKASRHFSFATSDTTQTAGSKLVGVVNRGPGSPRRIIHDTFVQIIDSTRTSLQIINPYFTLCPHLRKALRRACERGVDVEIMISRKSDIPITPHIVLHAAHRLMKHGARIWVYEGGFHHSKVLVADSTVVFIGSSNLDSRSLSFDYECNLVIADAAASRQIRHIFERDKTTRSFLLTPETYKTRYSRCERFAAWFWQFLTRFV